MRDVWELPKPSLGNRTAKVLLVLALLWSVVAVPVTVMLARRHTPPPPPPETRPLTAMEKATVRYAAQALSATPVTLKFTVVSPNAEMHVTETVDAARNIAYGQVSSQNQNADLIVTSGSVLLRGGPQFWASVGVPTSESGWIEAGNRLGDLPFPITEVISKMDPSASTYVDNPRDGADTTTFHNGDLTVVFTEAGPAEVTLAGRTAKLGPAPGDARARLDGSATTPIPPVKLIGGSGTLTVSGVPAPPPTSSTAAPESEK